MSKERVEIPQNCKDLLQFSAGDLIPMLAADKKLDCVKQSAFDYYNETTQEHYQVHVIVTRCESDFLGPFQTELISAYGS